MLNKIIESKMQACRESLRCSADNSDFEEFDAYPGMRLTDYVAMCMAEGVAPDLLPAETSYDDIGEDALENAFLVDPYGDVRTDPFELMESSRNAQRRQVMKSMETSASASTSTSASESTSTSASESTSASTSDSASTSGASSGAALEV